MAKKSIFDEAVEEANLFRNFTKEVAAESLQENFSQKVREALDAIDEADDEDEEEVDEASDSSKIGGGDNKMPDAKASSSSAQEDPGKKDVGKEADEQPQIMKEEDEEEKDDVDEAEDVTAESDELEEGDIDEELQEIIASLEESDDEEEDEVEEASHDKEGDEGEEDQEVEEAEEEGEDDELDLDELDELLDEWLREAGEEDEEGEEEEVEEASSEMAAENAQLKSELKEAISTINHLRKTMNEVNVLNAKLFYSNKLFRGNDLNESQKMKIVEGFDRARTVRDVKYAYSLLAEAFTYTGKKKTSTKKRVVEGFASKPTGRAKKPMNESTGIVNADSFKARMQKLANIK